VIWGAPVLVVLVFAALTAANPAGLVVGVAFGTGTATLALVGAVLAERAPDNRIGAWLLVASVLITASVALESFATTGQAANPPWPGAAIAALAGNIPMVIAVVIVLIGVPAIFPTGRLLSPRWRSLVGIMVVALLATCVSMLIAGSKVTDPGVVAAADALSAVSTCTFGIGFIGALSSVGIRFRRGSPVEREQTKWFFAATVFAVVAAPLAFLAPQDTPFGVILLMVALVAQPVAIGIAVLRYRLYRIDQIVSRTIAYVLISGVLVAVYVGFVLGLRAVVGELAGGGAAGVAVSTLVVASLFQPVRRRIQSVVDRRFNRHHYDAERTAAAFARQLREEVNLDAVLDGLVEAVRVTVAPAGSGIWIRRRGAARR
jgi:hypothetical protein